MRFDRITNSTVVAGAVHVKIVAAIASLIEWFPLFLPLGIFSCQQLINLTSSVYEFFAGCFATLLYHVDSNSFLLAFYSGGGELYEEAVRIPAICLELCLTRYTQVPRGIGRQELRQHRM